MRNLNLIIAFFLIHNLIAQNCGTITYRLSSEKLKVEDNQSKTKKDLFKLLNSMNRLRDSLYFNLDFSNNKSHYYLDKKKNIGISNEKGYNTIIKSFGSSEYYKDTEEKILIEQVNSDRLYLIISDLDGFEWNLTKEVKKINDYFCLKATSTINKNTITGNRIIVLEAWYCPEVNINLGPKNYGGLPGLIFELKEGKLTYYLHSIDLNEVPIIKKPNKGKVVTRDEYNSFLPTITKENFKEYIGN